jgi:hypothetical protein
MIKRMMSYRENLARATRDGIAFVEARQYHLHTMKRATVGVTNSDSGVKKRNTLARSASKFDKHTRIDGGMVLVPVSMFTVEAHRAAARRSAPCFSRAVNGRGVIERNTRRQRTSPPFPRISESAIRTL